MTTIFICKNVMAADSNYVNQGDTFSSLTKIEAFPKPYTVREQAIVEGKPCLIEGTFHGFTATGRRSLALNLIQVLVKGWEARGVAKEAMPSFGMQDLVEAIYASRRMGFLDWERDTLTLVLIGTKQDWKLSVDGIGTLSWEPVPRDDPFAMGTGAQTALASFMRYGDYLRAMHETLLTDPCSKGIIDIWKLPSEADPTFYRMGLCNDRTVPERWALLKEADAGKGLTPDLLSTRFLEEHLGTLTADDTGKGPSKKASRKPFHRAGSPSVSSKPNEEKHHGK